MTINLEFRLKPNKDKITAQNVIYNDTHGAVVYQNYSMTVQNNIKFEVLNN